MKRLLSVVVAAAVLSAGAISNVAAQDILRLMRSPPVASWTGFYVGGNFGYGWAKDSSTATTITGTAGQGASSFTMKGMVAGGQLGAQIQSDKFVAGIESDLQGSWQKFTGPANATNLYSALGVAFTGNDSVSIDWFGTTRLRAGVAVDNVLIYGTGGVAYGAVKSTANLAGVSLLKDSPVKLGWAGGGGVEALLSRNWTVRAEYLHIDFGATDEQYISGGTQLNLHQRITDDIVRVGVNYIIR